ncbi:hypothetical protein [Deinococcus aquiradiocola]|uniref:Lipoprotein n=1 Tax=Deinococcus aquiradiocola TaxID=393059 RepID=A0A917UPX2_9DEIO|nr:hypothetical protein [Deinococcus aquiradiocola]GGJ73426.1 hypothetical protein GCM10008939_17170 [Deinococcus aquiradiocola]
MSRPALLVAAALLLAGCTPTVSPARPSTVRPGAPALQASFSESGVLWLEGGRVTLARAPAYRRVSVPLQAQATAVGWQTANRTDTPWVALGAVGVLVTADARPVVLQAGRVVALTATRAYREDGSTVSYDGTPGAGLLGTPDATVTGGDGLEYATQAGKLYRVDSGGQTLLSTAALPYLYATPGGAATSNAPTAVTASGSYTLTGTALERRDAAGVLLASVPHPPGVVGAVGPLIVTLQPGGTLRFFAPELRELTP